MTSKVSICNLALSRIRASEVENVTTERSKSASACKIHYDPSRKSALRDHDWNFARKEITLALLTETYTGWTYAYQYPTDCLMIRKIFDVTGEYTSNIMDYDGSYTQVGKVKYEIRANSALNQKVILTDSALATLL